MNEYMFDLVILVVIVCVTLVTRYVIPYLKALVHSLEYDELLDTVKQAVKAAEQTIKASGQGKAKKAEVEAFISNWLAEKGIHITEKQIDILIEAAVKTMNDSEKEE